MLVPVRDAVSCNSESSFTVYGLSLGECRAELRRASQIHTAENWRPTGGQTGGPLVFSLLGSLAVCRNFVIISDSNT